MENIVTAALYCRLSKEDVDKLNEGDESASIINQRIMLEDYALEQGFGIYDVYEDDDYSGLFDTRPSFERMIEDAKKHKFNVVIAKTQSRFTRNMEHMEHYLHDFFPSLGIRFIGVVDHVDTMSKGNKKSRQINGLINEWYCEDLSENVRAVFKSKMRQGQYLGQSAPYGYVKDPTDHHKLIIDKEAGEIVRRIFDMYINGCSKYRIAKTLNEEGQLNPSKYKSEVLKTTYYNPRNTATSEWTAQTVTMILRNEVYIGHVVQNKQGTPSYKTKKKVMYPEHEWIKVCNMHEPIIDQNTWELAQQLQKSRTREVKGTKRIDLFTDKLYCDHCGKHLCRYYNRNHEFLGYQCSTYRSFGTAKCSMHKILERPLKEAVLDTIKRTARQLLSPKDIKELDKIEAVHQEDTKERQLKECQVKKERIESNIDKVYKDYLDELITREQYIKYRNQFNVELNHINGKLLELNTDTEENNDNTEKIWREKFKNYIDIDELNRVVLFELIDKIIVSADGNIHIIFRFNNLTS